MNSTPANIDHLQPAAADQAFTVPDGLTPLSPVAGSWAQLRPPRDAPAHTTFWKSELQELGVVSSFGQKDGGLVHLLTIGRFRSRRCTTQQAQLVLLQFGIAKAEEVDLDGQHFTRNYIAPIPPAA